MGWGGCNKLNLFRLCVSSLREQGPRRFPALPLGWFPQIHCVNGLIIILIMLPTPTVLLEVPCTPSTPPDLTLHPGVVTVTALPSRRRFRRLPWVKERCGWREVLSVALSPWHQGGSWLCPGYVHQRVKEQGTFLEHPSVQRCTRAVGDAFKEGQALLYPLHCPLFVWMVTLNPCSPGAAPWGSVSWLGHQPWAFPGFRLLPVSPEGSGTGAPFPAGELRPHPPALVWKSESFQGQRGLSSPKEAFGKQRVLPAAFPGWQQRVRRTEGETLVGVGALQPVPGSPRHSERWEQGQDGRGLLGTRRERESRLEDSTSQERNLPCAKGELEPAAGKGPGQAQEGKRPECSS